MSKGTERNRTLFRSALLGVTVAEILFWTVVILGMWLKSEFAPHVDLHRPNWIIWTAILPVTSVAFLIHLKWKSRAVEKLSESHLQDITLPGFSQAREAWRFVVWRLAVAAILLGLIGPKVGSRLQEVETKGADFVIALDVSNSMLAEDLGLDRLTLARQTVERILNKLSGDRVGLVVFAGEAYVQCPLTSDYSAIKLYLNSITPGIIANQGTALGQAIEVSVKAFENAPASSRAILLITDGENHEDDPVAAAAVAFEAGITVHILGVATPEGAPIPNIDSRGRQVGFIQGPNGQPVVSRLDETVLVTTVQAGGGSFSRAKSNYIDISSVLEALNKEEKTRTSKVKFTDYDHKFQLILLVALCLILIESFIPHPTTRK